MNNFLNVNENSMEVNLCKTIINFYKELSNTHNKHNEIHIMVRSIPTLLQIETEILNILKLEVTKYVKLCYNQSTLRSNS
jgi:hypothetical protein